MQNKTDTEEVQFFLQESNANDNIKYTLQKLRKYTKLNSLEINLKKTKCTHKSIDLIMNIIKDKNIHNIDIKHEEWSNIRGLRNFLTNKLNLVKVLETTD